MSLPQKLRITHKTAMVYNFSEFKVENTDYQIVVRSLRILAE